jgi:hypothetical protein
MVRGCSVIDEFLMKLESPVINPDIAGGTFPTHVEKFPLLSKPSRRDVEVLVLGGGKWWRQTPIKAGATTTGIHFGNDQTKKGTEFPIVAMTCAHPLTNQTYPNLPGYRTKAESTVKR